MKEQNTRSESVRTALVTGGSRGIGRGIAFALAEQGYDLAISHWQDADNARITAESVKERFGRRCEVFEGNLELEDEPGKLAKRSIQSLGQIDVLVNNAGITLFNAIENIGITEVNRLLHLDLRAPLLLMQAIGAHMIERGIKGCLINITSARAERAYPMDAVYGSVKAGLTRATASIAIDLAAYGIRVNCIAPGAIKAQLPHEDNAVRSLENPGVPLHRSGTPADIGAAAVWLVSDAASYITGTTIRVDGGLILPGTPH